MKTFLLFVLLFAVFATRNEIIAQSEPVLYFCEHYDKDKGEVGVSDIFSKGYLSVVVKCDHALGLEDVHVQFDKYNFRTGKFDFYKKFDYAVSKDMSYIVFSKNEVSDMKFDEAGFYRVFLLDNDDKTVASSLIEITE